jgi:hypothetical protein
MTNAAYASICVGGYSMQHEKKLRTAQLPKLKKKSAILISFSEKRRRHENRKISVE